jgi:hypothetical protein
MAGEMSMSASDFLLLYGNEEQRDRFDAVATVFFLDTAPNIIRYIEAIRNCLRKGGLLINVGPLLWHFENNPPGSHGHQGNSSTDKEPRGETCHRALRDLANCKLTRYCRSRKCRTDRWGSPSTYTEAGI